MIAHLGQCSPVSHAASHSEDGIQAAKHDPKQQHLAHPGGQGQGCKVPPQLSQCLTALLYGPYVLQQPQGVSDRGIHRGLHCPA